MKKSIQVNTHHGYLNTDIVLSSTIPSISIEDKLTGQKWVVNDNLKIRLGAGHHILVCPELNEEILIIIEDAVKFGGSSLKKGFVFDDNSWVFVVMKDRTYITNIETKEEKIEYSITPDEILSLGMYNGVSNDYFLFRTNHDFSLYNVQLGKTTISFTNHIFSNSFYTIYKEDDKVVIFDYHNNCLLSEFDGQYSMGNKFYFVKANKLFGLDWASTRIKTIDFVGEVGNNTILHCNTLLKKLGDYFKQKDTFYKKYVFYDLGNGEDDMTSINFLFPYFIENWFGTETEEFQHVKNEWNVFVEKKKEHLSKNVSQMCYGLKFDSFEVNTSGNTKEYVFKGEIITYPDFYGLKPKFILKTPAGWPLKIDDISFCYYKDGNENQGINNTNKDNINIPKDEKLVAASISKKRIITRKDNSFYYHDYEKEYCSILLEKTFDKSSYTNAFFMSDGKHVVFQSIDGEFDIMGFEDLSLDKFEIDGSTVSRTSGFNGYKPIIDISENDSRIPIWRDAITLQRIDRDELSDRIFMSPDRNYSASTSMQTVYYNRLTGREMTYKEYQEQRAKYDWNEYPNNDEKKKEKEEKRKKRRKLTEEYPKEKWAERIIEKYRGVFDSPTNGLETKEQRMERIINSELEDYIEKKGCFTELFVDILGYICYTNNSTGEENRVLIGRSVYFLNYVSFSYNSRYLAFAAKMKQDSFRMTEDGVFVLYEIKEKKEIIRQDYENELYAVWMTMFSKTGNVAYYDSKADAYIATRESDYSIIERIPGRSLLCFSPSGNYIAFSDQNYIDYTHHPDSNWGHQPSGNVFIHSMNDIGRCLEQFNDFGEGISGVACRAGNVASAAFSLDEKRLMAVGDDGVIVIRNLHLDKNIHDKRSDSFTISDIQEMFYEVFGTNREKSCE